MSTRIQWLAVAMVVMTLTAFASFRVSAQQTFRIDLAARRVLWKLTFGAAIPIQNEPSGHLVNHLEA